PNRFSAVSPEPHVHVWGLGFLPRPLMPVASRLLGRGGYVGKRLLSLRELRGLMARTLPDYRLAVRRSNPHATSVAGRLFRATSPWSEYAFSHIDAEHVLLARRDHQKGDGA
ncbi:MAG TPA: hypothetical protein VK943_16360, partial [Arenibaculum sp.]|nr:hypothetical protein [Arenibaculum sp.]